MLLELSHPYVVKLRDVVCEDMRLHLVFDYVDQDLKHYIDKKSPKGLPEKEVKVSPSQLTRPGNPLPNPRRTLLLPHEQSVPPGLKAQQHPDQ